MNQEKGCDACIQKNLERREIPTCFFLKISEDMKDVKAYSFESFAAFLAKNRKNDN